MMYMVLTLCGCHPSCSAKLSGVGKIGRDGRLPPPPDMPAIEDAMVSIRAIGCRRDIADKIIAQKADYVLALKRTTGIFRIGVPATYNSPFMTKTTWRP